MIRELKLCRDCRHLDGVTCGHDEAAEQNPVDGTIIRLSAFAMRNSAYQCAREARFFDPIAPVAPADPWSGGEPF